MERERWGVGEREEQLVEWAGQQAAICKVGFGRDREIEGRDRDTET
jgi:hypothetical protein